MFTGIHTAHVYFSQIVKLSALWCIFRTNCNTNSGTTVHFYKLNLLRLVLVRLHQPWYSTVEIKRRSFHQIERLFVVEKAIVLRNVSHPTGKMIKLLTFMIMIEESEKGLTLYQMTVLSFRIENIFQTIKWLLIK